MPDTATNPIVALAGDSSRGDALRDRHCDYYVALAERGEREVRRQDQIAWRAALDAEYDNFRLALEWSLTQGDTNAALRLAIALFDIWQRRGDPWQAGDLVRKALALAGDAPLPLRAKALIRLGSADSAWTRNLPETFAIAEQALAVARECGNEVIVAEALLNMTKPLYMEVCGGAAAARGLMEEAEEIGRRLGDDLVVLDALSGQFWTIAPGEGRLHQHFDEVIELARTVGDLEHVAWKLYGKGWDEENAEAEKHTLEALEIARSLGNDDLIANCFFLLGTQKKERGEVKAAFDIFRSALDEYRRPGRRWRVAWIESWMLSEMAGILLDLGDAERARQLAEDALEVMRRDSGTDDIAATVRLARAVAAAGDYQRARTLCERATELAEAFGYPRAVFDAALNLGYIAYCAGDSEAAQDALERAATKDWSPFLRSAMHVPSMLLGRLAVDRNDADGARPHFQRALQMARYSNTRAAEPEVQMHLAWLARAEGEPATAAALYSAALTTFHKIGHRPFMALVLEDLAGLAAERDESEKGARLLGAAEKLREETAVVVPLHQRRHYDTTLAATRAGLDAATFDAAWASGRSLTLDEMLDAALDA